MANEHIMDWLKDLQNSDQLNKQASTAEAPATTTSRSAENSSDVKDVIPNSVDAANPAEAETGGNRGEDSAELHQGVSAHTTGINVQQPKTSISDPGTSHPAKVGGTVEKAASLNETGAALIQLLTQMTKAASETPSDDGGEPAKATDAGETTSTAEIKKEDLNAPTSKEEVVGSGSADDNSLNKSAAAERALGKMYGDFLAAAVTDSKEQTKQAQADPKAELEKAAALANHLEKSAAAAADDVRDFLIGVMHKQANQPIPPELAMAMGGEGAPAPIDPAMLAADPAAAPAPAPEAGGELSEEEIMQLASALAEQGVEPEMFDNMDGVLASIGAEGGEPAPEAPAEAPAEDGGEEGSSDKVDEAQAEAMASDGSEEEKAAAAKAEELKPGIMKLAAALKAQAEKA